MKKSAKDRVSSGRVSSGGVSRRRFLAGGGATFSGALLLPGALRQQPTPACPAAEAGREGSSSLSQIRLTVNGVRYELEVADHRTLAEVLRDQLGFTGTKIGCNRGECGACTVVLDGKAVYSCSEIAVRLNGSTITTIEGLARGEELDPLQQAFIDHDGLQCGFCTSGQIMAAKALLDANPNPTEAEVKRGLSGNLCRCGCYNHIVEAVLDAAAKLRTKG